MRERVNGPSTAHRTPRAGRHPHWSEQRRRRCPRPNRRRCPPQASGHDWEVERVVDKRWRRAQRRRERGRGGQQGGPHQGKMCPCRQRRRQGRPARVSPCRLDPRRHHLHMTALVWGLIVARAHAVSSAALVPLASLGSRVRLWKRVAIRLPTLPSSSHSGLTLVALLTIRAHPSPSSRYIAATTNAFTIAELRVHHRSRACPCACAEAG